MANVQLWLYSPTGILQQPNIATTALEWTLEENAFGVLRATGPLSGVDPAWFAIDARVEVHRAVGGGALYVEGDTQFLLRYWSMDEAEDGSQSWSIEAYTPEYILTGRIIDTFASTDLVTNPLATKTDNAGDVIKAFLRENGGASTTLTARKITELTVDADLGDGVSITKSASHNELYKTMRDIAADSTYQGTYLSFGMTKTSGAATGWTLHTWATQRGADHRAGRGDPVILSREMGSLRSSTVYYDYRDAVTAVRAGGQGEGEARTTVRVESTTASAASPNAYREDWIEATNCETETALTAKANAELQKRSPKRGFSGKFLDSDYARYGERVRFGDLVTAKAFGQSFDCRLARVAGRWTLETGEDLDIDLLGETSA